MASLLNPYTHQTFFPFLFVFFKRMSLFVSGNLPFSELASDEIQIFVLSALSFSGAIIGTFLVLRKMTMLANALSHTILLGIVAAFLITRGFSSIDPFSPLPLGILFVASFISAGLTTFFTDFLHRHLRLQEDASIGLVFTSFFALGILLISLLTRNLHLGTELVMGNVDALVVQDLFLVTAVCAINCILLLLLYRGLKITTFDAGLARILGFSSHLFSYLLMFLTSLTAIVGFRAVGVLLVLAFFVFPYLIARLLTHRLKVLIFLAILIGLAVSVGELLFLAIFYL